MWAAYEKEGVKPKQDWREADATGTMQRCVRGGLVRIRMRKVREAELAVLPPGVVGRFRAVEDYQGEQSTDLIFQQDEIILVTAKEVDGSSEWWRGYVEGVEPVEIGDFPANLVKPDLTLELADEPEQYCKRCKELFTGDECPGGHRSFMYISADEARSGAYEINEPVADDDPVDDEPEEEPADEQFCKKCKQLFDGDECPDGHRPVFYISLEEARRGGFLKDTAEPGSASSRSSRTPATQKRGRNSRDSRGSGKSSPRKSGGQSPKDRQSEALLDKLRKKLRAFAVSSPRGKSKQEVLFAMFDRNHDGAIDQREFIGGVRKKGQMTAVTISDEDLRKVFDEIDTDNNGTVNVHELGEFVWGEGAWRDALQEQSQERPELYEMIEEAAQLKVQDLCNFSVPEDDRDLNTLWNKVRSGARQANMNKVDVGIKRLKETSKLYHKDVVKLAFRSADANGDKAIQKSEFRDLLEFVVLFSGMRKVFAKMDTSADGRVNRREFFASCRKLPRGKQLGDDDLDLAFVAIDRDGGGEIRFSELCEWAAFNHRLEPRAAAAGAADSPAGTPGYQWSSHPDKPWFKRLLQDQSLDDMQETLVDVTVSRGMQVKTGFGASFGITWWQKKNDRDSLVIKAINRKAASGVLAGTIRQHLEKLGVGMIVRSVNGEDCWQKRFTYAQTLDALNTAWESNRQMTVQFAMLEPKPAMPAGGAASGAEAEGVLCYARAVADYAGDEEGDLAFEEGEKIAVTHKTDDDWWIGYLVEGSADDEGNFPVNHVEELPPEPEPEPEPEPARTQRSSPSQPSRRRGAGTGSMYCKVCKECFTPSTLKLCPNKHPK